METEIWPRRLPDLYHGEPLILKARLNQAKGEMMMTGRIADSLWRSRMNLEQAVNDQGVGVLWARAKIAALMDSMHDGVSQEDVKKSVIEVALAHHLVSRYTSLVAVDKLVSRPQDKKLASHKLPVNLPYGWKYEKVFGPNTGNNRQPHRSSYPRTATGADFLLLIGSGLLLLALLLFWLERNISNEYRR